MKFKLISIILLLFGGTTGALGLNGGSIIGNISAPTHTVSSNKTTTPSPATSGDKVTETNNQKVVNESKDKVTTNGASNTKVNDENNKVTNKVVDVNSSKSEVANKVNTENSNQTVNSKTNDNEKEQVTNKVTNVTPSKSETSNKVVSENNNKTTTTNGKNSNVANKAQTVNSSNEQNNTLFMAQVEQAIYKQVNEQRVKAGVAPLSYSSTMQQFARYKSEDMGKNHYFSHESPSGQYTIDRIKAAGIPYTAWGENIAYIEGVTNPTELANEFMTNWMNSPGHRANILSPNFTSIGVGVYKAGNTVYATQEFYKQ